MEKRRRARINHCLNELKSLILDAMKKDVRILSFLFFPALFIQQVVRQSKRTGGYPLENISFHTKYQIRVKINIS